MVLTRKIGLFIACVLSLSLLSASLVVAEPQQQQLEQQGIQMHISLANLKSLSMSLTEELEQQSQRAETLQMKLNESINYSQNMNAQLLDSEMKLTISESKSKAKTKVIVIESIIIALLIAMKALKLILKAKGAAIPMIADLIL